MSTTTEPTVQSNDASTTSAKKTKRKLSPEEIRQRRKRQAAKRRARILAGSGGGDDEESEKNARLAYLKGQDSKEALKKAEEQNLKKSSQTTNSSSSTPSENNKNSQNTQNSTPQYMTNNDPNGGIRDAFNSQNQSPFGQYQNGRTDNSSNATPFQLPPGMTMEDLVTAMNGQTGTGGIPGFGGLPDMSMPRIDPNADIDDMMKGMFGGMFNDLLGGMNGNNQTSDQILKKWKREERLNRFNGYTHNIFCLLFVLLLVFLPYDYEPNIFGYSLSSDPWTFFIGFEIVIFSVFYGYQQYSQGKDERNQQQRNGMMGGGGLMAMMGAGMFGGGQAAQSMIKKWIDRAMMLWSYVKMLRKLLSDLCLVLFLWIILTLIKTWIMGE